MVMSLKEKCYGFYVDNFCRFEVIRMRTRAVDVGIGALFRQRFRVYLEGFCAGKKTFRIRESRRKKV